MRGAGSVPDGPGGISGEAVPDGPGGISGEAVPDGPGGISGEAVGVAADVLRTLARRGWTLAVAESLTGGLLAAELVAVPGASQVFRGGAVTYATETKAQVLGVDADLLALRGPVDPDVARQMARGARELFRAEVGLATTGVAGPSGQGGKAPGHVYVAVDTVDGGDVRELHLAGDRARIRTGTVAAALALALAVLDASPGTREQS